MTFRSHDTNDPDVCSTPSIHRSVSIIYSAPLASADPEDQPSSVSLTRIDRWASPDKNCGRPSGKRSRCAWPELHGAPKS